MSEVKRMIDDLTGRGYSVLSPLSPLPKIETEEETKVGAMIDVETTGLNPDTDEIIQLAISFFRYTPSGVIVEMPYDYCAYNEPILNEISPEIQMVTGITPDMVAGHKIDVAHIEKCMSKVSLCVAHNARFDRRFMEHLSPAFSVIPWACSMNDIDWLSHGFVVKNLFYIMTRMGFNMSGNHAADFDVLATITAVSQNTAAGTPYFAELLANARRPSWRFYVKNTRYEDGDKFRERNYKWSDGVKYGLHKGWRLDVHTPDEGAAERAFHQELGLHADQVVVNKITAVDRYSSRV